MDNDRALWVKYISISNPKCTFLTSYALFTSTSLYCSVLKLAHHLDSL